MQLRLIPVTPFAQNCSLVWCEHSARGCLVDPGGEPERILQVVAELGVQVERILLTHGHLDHVGAAGVLAAQLGVPILGPHADDAFLFDALPMQAGMFGFAPVQAFRPRRWLRQGERVQCGSLDLEVLHCPGHTPGHVVFLAPDARLAWVGDVLFRGGIGRTDFPRGNHADLIRSITQVLLPRGDDIRFVPGHGPMSDFGHERLTNPFLRTP